LKFIKLVGTPLTIRSSKKIGIGLITLTPWSTARSVAKLVENIFAMTFLLKTRTDSQLAPNASKKQ
jgi:hypothetical protein